MRIRSVVSGWAGRAGLILLLLTTGSPLRAQDEAYGSAEREWRFIEKLEKDGMADLVLRQLEAFASSFRDDPRAPRALLRAANGYREAGADARAIELYERLLRDFPSAEDAPVAGLARADLLSDAQRFEQAAAAYRAVLDAYPASPQAESALLGLAEALMAQNDDVEARRLLGRLVGGRASDEVGSRALFDLALLDLRAGADSLAIERFDSIHRRYPGRPIGAFGLFRAATLLQEREAPAAARERYERVLELHREPILRARAHLGLAAIVEASDPKLAATHYRAVAEQGGTAEDVEGALLGLARASLAAKDPKSAREAATAFLARHPESPRRSRAELVLALADLAQKKGGVLEVLIGLGEAADAEVAYEALSTAAGLQETAGDVRGALDTWRRVERVAPSAERRAQALLEQARIAATDARPALAAELALTAHDLAEEAPTRAQALRTVLEAQVRSGQRDAAIATARRTMAEYPLTEHGTAAREHLRRLERETSLDPAGAARVLGELAQRQIDDPAARSIEVAVVVRDRLGDHESARAILRTAIGQAEDAAQRARAEMELARTHLQEAASRGSTGDRDGALDSIRQARAVLGEAAGRDGGGAAARQAYLTLIGLDLADAARPAAPWTFDPERTPMATELAGPGGARGTAIESARRRLEAVRDKAADKDQRAWITWRWAEVVDAQPRERIEAVRAAIETKPRAEMEAALRLVHGQLLLADESSAEAARELARVIEHEAASEIGMAARYALAEAHRAQNRYAQAGELYAEYAAAMPLSFDGERALLLAGDCAFYAARPDLAIERYRQLVERYPGSAYQDDALFRLGTALERTGRLEAAREPLERLSRETSGSEYRGRALAALANLERKAGRPERARAALEELTRVDPDRAVEEGAWNQLARVMIDEGDPARALQWLDQGAKRTQPDAAALALRVEAASRKGDLGAASSALQSFSRAFADEADRIASARLHLAAAQRDAERLDAALESAKTALGEARDPVVKAQAHHEMGMIHARARRWSDARAAWEAADRQAPGSDWAAESLLRLGQYHASLNEDAAAQKAFAALATRFPQSVHAADALRGEARAWRQMGRYDLALERYHRLLEEHPDAPGAEDVLSNIAYCHHEMGQYEIAIAAYRRVMPFLDEEGQAYAVFWIADGLDRLGRHREAATEFLRIPYLYPDQGMLPVTAQLKAAEAYERVPDPDAARALYERVLRGHGPGSDWGREAQQRLDRLPEPASREGERGGR